VPAFDHQVHDPEEDAITILPSHKVILVEGNYLLLPDEPWRELWDGAGALLDERWFVDTAVDDAMTRVMGRHVAVGRSAEEAKSRADGNDRLNGEMVWAARGNADVHVPSYEWEGA
jgi:pantothenate kinase